MLTAENREAIIQNTIVYPNCLNSCPERPERSARGRNTTQVVMVPPVMEMCIRDRINGFITETVNSTGIGSVQLTQAGLNHLDGVQAVAYSRLRLMDTDFQRTRCV